MRPKGVADAQTVDIPSPPKDLSAGTLLEGRSQVLVLVEIEGKLVPKSGWIRGEKSPEGYLRRPYRKPTQVDGKRILRPTGEG